MKFFEGLFSEPTTNGSPGKSSLSRVLLTALMTQAGIYWSYFRSDIPDKLYELIVVFMIYAFGSKGLPLVYKFLEGRNGNRKPN